MELLIVASKVKSKIKNINGFNTSAATIDALSEHVHKIIDQAISHATQDGRKTVMDRDIIAVLNPNKEAVQMAFPV